MWVQSVAAVALATLAQTCATRVLPARLSVVAPSSGWLFTALVLRTKCPIFFGLVVCTQSLIASVCLYKVSSDSTLICRLFYSPLVVSLVVWALGSFVHPPGSLVSVALITLQLWSSFGGVIMLACFPASVVQLIEPQRFREQRSVAYTRHLTQDRRKVLQRHTIPSSNGVQLDALAILQPYQTDNWVVYFGGNAEFMENTILDICIVGDGIGANMILYNARGIGRSTGFVTQVSDLIEDAAAVVHYFLHKQNVPPSRMVLFGHSIGGALAAVISERCFPDVALVVDRSFSTLADAAVPFSPFTPAITRLLLPFFVGDLDAVVGWSALQHKRKLITFCRHDEIIRFGVSSIARLPQFLQNGSDRGNVIELNRHNITSCHNQVISAFEQKEAVFQRIKGFFPT